MDKYPIREVPKRISDLKNILFDTPTKYCFERALIVTRSYQASEGEHESIRRAKALRDVFLQIPIFIREGELIVGQRAAVLAGRSVYPEYNIDSPDKASLPTEIWSYWHGRTIADKSRRAFPERLRLSESEKASGYVTGTNSGFGHVIVDYEKAIRKGFRSIAAEAGALLERTPKDDEEGRAFLAAVVISAQGIMDWAMRYADLAGREAESESDPARRNELLRIADACRRVPAEPARTFAEALQSFWFVHMAMHIEQYGWSISAGRFDQYMYPFYRQDIESGAISEDTAWELLLSLWVKFMENVNSGVKDTLFQNLTLGGRDIEGNDQSNALSGMCLDATAALRFNQPALSVRWHPGIHPGFWDHVQHTIAKGMGLPALFNDEVILAALAAHGVAPEDAVGYGLVGCVEASVPGKQQGVTAGGHINCAKALELALNNGFSMITGKRIGLPTGEPAGFQSFEDLWSAYKDQIEYLSGLDVLSTHITGEIQKQYGYCPLMSSLLEDCLENRRDMVYGGTRYNLPGVAVFGPSNTCDGMMAIKKWVCDEKRLTWKELQQVLLDDYEGHEEIRLL
ncbi:MAG TPA: pyruvate formate lyase family protein, partial [Clostridia bacterium]